MKKTTKQNGLKAIASFAAAFLMISCAILIFTDDEDDGSNDVLGAGVSPVISASGSSYFAVKDDGTLWSWGANNYGMLGDGTTTGGRMTPEQVKGPGGIGYLTDVKTVTAGWYHILALKNDGTVWTWGFNNVGQLGDGTTVNRSTPVQVPISEVKAITAGSYHSVALKTDGTVWTWGGGTSGQLGNGASLDSSMPVQVEGVGGSGNLIGVKAIASGSAFCLAVKNDGAVVSWGSNTYGQLGNGESGSGTNKNAPVNVMISATTPLTGGDSVAAGHYHSLAMLNDGTVRAWGYNEQGQLGSGSSATLSASPVLALTNAAMIDAGGYNSLAVKKDGTLWSWGSGSFGQIGDGDSVSRNAPVQVLDLTDARLIAVSQGCSLALKDDGTVWAWGDNQHGLLGIDTITKSETPMCLSGFSLTTGSESTGGEEGVGGGGSVDILLVIVAIISVAALAVSAVTLLKMRGRP